MIILAIYGPFSFYLLIKHRSHIDSSTRVTIFIYFLSIIVLLGYSLYDFFTIKKDDPKGIHIPMKTSDFVIIAVFYYFIYELRLVKLKLQCVDFNHFCKELKRTKIYLLIIYIIISLTLALEISLEYSKPD